MILYLLEPDGGFLVGDTETRFAAYAYPTSDHADAARKDPAAIAATMLEEENKLGFCRASSGVPERDAKWMAKLEALGSAVKTAGTPIDHETAVRRLTNRYREQCAEFTATREITLADYVRRNLRVTMRDGLLADYDEGNPAVVRIASQNADGLTKHQIWVLRTLAKGAGHVVGNCRADRLAIESMPPGLVDRAESTFRGETTFGYVITD